MRSIRHFVSLALAGGLMLCALCLCACSGEAATTAGKTSEKEVLAVSDRAATNQSAASANAANASQGDQVKAETSQSEAANLKIASQTNQIVIVRANPDTTCTVALHELIDGAWQCTVEDSGVVGTGGVGQASETTTVTPAGAYGLGFAFGSAPNPGTEMEYRQTSANTCWVDDPSSAYYNQFVYISDVQQDWNSAEYLAESPGAYRYAAFIQYNVNPAVPGNGSAFFLHCYASTPSAGCVQTSQDTMVSILQRLRDGAMIVIGNGDEVLYY